MNGPAAQALDDIQANLARVSKYHGGATRDWSLFFFFRIMNAAEMSLTRDALLDMRNVLQSLDEGNAEGKSEHLSRALHGMNVQLANAGVFDASQRRRDFQALIAKDKSAASQPPDNGASSSTGAAQDGDPAATVEGQPTPPTAAMPAPSNDMDAPAKEFRAWLSLISGSTKTGVTDGLHSRGISPDGTATTEDTEESDPAASLERIADIAASSRPEHSREAARRVSALLLAGFRQKDPPDKLGALIRELEARAGLESGSLLSRGAASLWERIERSDGNEEDSDLYFDVVRWISEQMGKDVPQADTPEELLNFLLSLIVDTNDRAEIERISAKIVLILFNLLLQNIQDGKKVQSIVDVIVELGERLARFPLYRAALFQAFTAVFRLVLSSGKSVAFIMAAFGEQPGDAGRTAIGGRLPLLCLYEILRQFATATRLSGFGGITPETERSLNELGYTTFRKLGDMSDEAALAVARHLQRQEGEVHRWRDEAKAALDGHRLHPLVRGISADESRVSVARATGSGSAFDPAPIDIAFSYSGLQMLQLDSDTLESFPEAFKEGMAARAKRLGDTGESAPEHWDGELGLKSVHGFFSGGFQVGTPAHPPREEQWRAIREDIRVFNGRIGSRGNFLRALLGALFRPHGMEIVHLELGQDPYEVEGGRVKKLAHRREHFGFRDGISQPFVNMGLGDPAAGGGTPDAKRTWSPVAPGEIYLGHPDEDGNIHRQPCNAKLRNNGTYLVFRKLEQDVIGFRNFLKRMRSEKIEQERLAARFVGRWKNGAPLVTFPDAPVLLEGEVEHKINDFLYAADDPRGARCPLGSHVRRTNPRDIGGGNEVRRHRILRRSIGYGGPLLRENSDDDAQKRGLLFVAANSRIEQQFEVVQADWINGGEFLGQAGLGRCPLTGNNEGTFWDVFLEPAAVTPIVQLPRFVVMRGGEYFFAPSATAVAELADDREKFPPDAPIPQGIGNARTPALFDEERIATYIWRLVRGTPAITVKMPQLAPRSTFPVEHTPHDLDPRARESVVFVGRHDDVTQVLKENTGPGRNYNFSVAHYRETARRATRGGDVVISTEAGGVTDAARQKLHFILNKAWDEFTASTSFDSRWEALVDDHCERAIRRAARSGRIDVVQDFATDAVYGLVSRFFGVTGPDFLTELAVALPFSRSHVGQLHPDWLAAAKGEAPRNARMMTLQIWSVVFLADLIANVAWIADLQSLSEQACSEFLNHFDDLITQARRHPPAQPQNLIDAFVAIEKDVSASYPGYTASAYYRDVSAILLELTSATMANIPAIFGELINTLLSNRVDIATLVPLLTRPMPTPDTTGIRRLILETDRLSPAFGLFMRHCEKDTVLSSGVTIKKDQWVVALVNAANFDDTKFPSPQSFSLFPFLPGPDRNPDNYLLFGKPNSGRDCWGRQRFALAFLERLMLAVGKIQGMRKVPGPEGELKKLLRINIGLQTRFARTG